MNSVLGDAVYRFGDCELDVGLHELRFGGERRGVEPQAFDLLIYLIENRDRMVGRDELIEHIWQGRIVSDASLSTAVKQARQAIGDSGQTQTYIRTVPRRGFRFVGELADGAAAHDGKPAGTKSDEDEPASSPRRTRKNHTVIATSLLVLIALGGIWWWQPWTKFSSDEEIIGKPSIAVLPFTNFSNDEKQEFFADGMTDALITRLSKVNGLRVISRNSVFTYKGKNAKIEQIAKDLGVRYVLESSVQRAGGTVRINSQLIDTEHDGHLWAEIFDRNMDDIFALQDEVTAKIIAALKIELTPSELEKLAQLPTDNLQAYDYYLKARKAHFTYWANGLRSALALYKKATVLDPNFADAFAGQAAAAGFVAQYNLYQVMMPAGAILLAKKAIANALEVAPNNGAALGAKSYILKILGHHSEAIATARQAVNANPNNTTLRIALAEALTTAGKVGAGLTEIELALQMNPKPRNYDGYMTGWVYFMNRQYERALEFHHAVVERNPKYWQAHNGIIVASAQLDQLEEARKLADIRVKGWSAFSWQALALHRQHWEQGIFDHWLGAIKKAGIPEWPFGFEGDETNRLTGSEIAELMLGHRLEGKTRTGGKFSQNNNPDGKWIWKIGNFEITGNGRVEGDLWCIKVDEGLPEREYCVPIYRNPSGSRDERNEYVRPDVYDIHQFSVVD